MGKLPIIERLFMALAFISAAFSFLINIDNGYQQFSWQLCVMMWVAIAYLKMRMSEDQEKDKNKL
jgi:hypothetical protein